MNKQNQTDIKSLVGSRQWSALIAAAEAQMALWGKERSVSDDQFVYLKDSLTRDGKMAGLETFIQALEKIANAQ